MIHVLRSFSWRMMGFITTTSAQSFYTDTYQLGIYRHCLYSAWDILPSSGGWWPSWRRNHPDLWPCPLHSQCLTFHHDSMVSVSQILLWQYYNYTWSQVCVYKSAWYRVMIVSFKVQDWAQATLHHDPGCFERCIHTDGHYPTTYHSSEVTSVQLCTYVHSVHYWLLCSTVLFSEQYFA